MIAERARGYQSRVGSLELPPSAQTFSRTFGMTPPWRGSDRASGGLNQAFDHGRKTRLVFGANAFELQAEATSPLDVADRSAGTNFAVFHEEMQFYRRTSREGLWSFEQKTPDAEITDPRGIFGTTATPKYPNALGRINALKTPSRHQYMPFCVRVNHLRGPTS
jgi:hypothetical protein